MSDVRKALLGIVSGMETIYPFTLCHRKALGLSSLLRTYWKVKALRHKQINKRVNLSIFDCKLIQFLRQGWQKTHCFVLCFWMPRPETHAVTWQGVLPPAWSQTASYKISSATHRHWESLNASVSVSFPVKWTYFSPQVCHGLYEEQGHYVCKSA